MGAPPNPQGVLKGLGVQGWRRGIGGTPPKFLQGMVGTAGTQAGQENITETPSKLLQRTIEMWRGEFGGPKGGIGGAGGG